MKTSKLVLTLGFVCALCACEKKEVSDNSPEARELFNRSAALIIETTNSLQSAKDITELDSLNSTYEKRITDLNFQYPPQTDYKLTEEENDSLSRLMKRMEYMKKEKIREFEKQETDTIPNEI